ncbi:trypsin-like peptidase domain-containing protein [Neptunicella marina]
MKKRSWGYFFTKSILLGVVVSAVMLLLIPDLRQGTGLELRLFNQPSTANDRVSFHEAVKSATPAVVDIYSTGIETRPFPYRGRQVERASLGSGVIMSEQGYILTCYHVIRNAETISVRLSDGRILDAQQVGQDPYTDLAVLKIDEENLPVIPQREQTNTRVGDVVLAIGNPYNLGKTITQGVISATGRNGLSNYLTNSNGYAGFIQMDAVLNEGNSGGALVDSNGVLVGINNANFKTLDNQNRVKDVAGIFFAVPYELAKKVMDSIITNGRVIRGYLGISANEERDPKNMLPGILVTHIEPFGPAAKAGLRPEDIITKVNNTQVEGVLQVLDIVAETKPGDEITFEIIRNKKIMTVPVIIGELGAS